MDSMTHWRIDGCRSCNNPDLTPVISLGEMPLANSLPAPQDIEKTEDVYPLDISFCSNCALVQITETVSPEVLFSEYLYFSSYSDTVLSNAKDISRRMMATRNLGENNLVVEIGSNDGYLLRNYAEAGVPVLGIEPASNVAVVAREEYGIPTFTEFFTEEFAGKLRAEGKRADVIHANNVLAHVPQQNEFVRGIGNLLSDEGVAVIEVPYLRDLVEKCEFDTIYHEHLCYFSVTALNYLFARNGLEIVDVERIPIHGGTLRLFVSNQGVSTASGAVQAILTDESEIGMDRYGYYEGFAQRIEALKTSLRKTLIDLNSQGKTIAGYGAAAKGAVLLNYFELGSAEISYVVDRNPAKQSRFMPGVQIPISSPARLLGQKPDYLLLLAWNFADEIIRQQAEFAKTGGKFIIPVPEVKII